MRLWLSGEGPTDLGTLRPGPAGPDYVPGPMAVIVDRLAELRLGFSLLDLHQSGGDCIRYVRETDLAQHGRKGPLLLPGVKFGRHNTWFTRNAQVLGQLAKADAQGSGRPTAAVLFRDGDGTRSMPRSQWQAKFESIQRGFQIADFGCGVAMVPRPKSEAWLLCALRPPAYANCAGLEDAPGNDSSPHALKRQLDAAAGHTASADEQAQWVRDGAVDPQRIDMPSFAAFRAELERALDRALA